MQLDEKGLTQRLWKYERKLIKNDWNKNRLKDQILIKGKSE